MGRRGKKSLLDPAEAHLFALQTIHEETSKLLSVVEEICHRFPPNEDLIFLRYLLRMIELETRSSIATGEWCRGQLVKARNVKTAS